MGFFKSKEKLKDTRNAEAKSADQWMAELLKSDNPEIPTEQIAGMSDAEKLAQELVMGYGSKEAEGLDTLRSMAGASDNVLDDPTITALMDVIGKRGDQTANRLNRSLMLRGGTGGAGRDMLGRSVSDTQNEMLSTLAPYASQAKDRKMNAAQLLASLGESSTLNRLNALSTTGSLPRTLQQMQNAASYNQTMNQILFDYQQKAPIASTLSNSQPLTMVQTPSMFSQVAPLLGTAVGAAVGGPAGAAAGNQLGSAAGNKTNSTVTPSGWQQSGNLNTNYSNPDWFSSFGK